tara:strand:+ start:5148 stop:5609 length:462 start_codon:yes stop_codon:yes gene_type:complete
MADKTKIQLPFWEAKKIQELSQDEWESLCDGCGKCCLQKLQDEDTEELHFTCISCQFLDKHSCRCKVYENRFEHLPECLNLTKESLGSALTWLPNTCAYKLIHEEKSLPAWHHLISENKEMIHILNLSVRDKVISELDVNEDDWEDYIVDIDR